MSHRGSRWSLIPYLFWSILALGLLSFTNAGAQCPEQDRTDQRNFVEKEVERLRSATAPDRVPAFSLSQLHACLEALPQEEKNSILSTFTNDESGDLGQLMTDDIARLLSVPERGSFSLVADNDVLSLDAGTNEDRNYTMGIVLRWTGSWTRNRAFNWTHRTLESPFKLFFRHRPARRVSSFIIGIQVFTPDNLADPDPILDDRPYGSFLFAGTEQYRLVGKKTSLMTHLSLGALGLRVSESVQTGIHVGLRRGPEARTGLENPRDPQGWDHQISDGFEPSGRIAVGLQHSLFRRSYPKSDLGFEVIPGASLSAGTNTEFSASLAFRFLNTPTSWTHYVTSQRSVPGMGPSNVPSVEPKVLNPMASLNTSTDPSRGDGVTDLRWTGRNGRITWLEVPQMWMIARGGASAYNVMLQGQFRHSDVCYKSSQIRNLGAQFSAGFSTTILNIRIGYAAHLRSPDLSFGPTKYRWHQWGTLSFGWTKVW